VSEVEQVAEVAPVPEEVTSEASAPVATDETPTEEAAE